MNLLEVGKKLKIIFEKEILDTRDGYISWTYRFHQDKGKTKGVKGVVSIPFVIKDTEKYYLDYENLKLMQILYNSLDTFGKMDHGTRRHHPITKPRRIHAAASSIFGAAPGADRCWPPRDPGGSRPAEQRR